MSLKDSIIKERLPKHIAIIMDGNGRWATSRGKSRSFGHREGSKNVDRIVTHAFKTGVKTLTLYAFSAENWSRPKEEVDELMRLLKIYFTQYIKKAVKNEVRVKVIGDKGRLSDELKEIIDRDEESSARFKDRNLLIAVNYGARQEIVRAVNELIGEGKEITDDAISSHLYTSEFGEPDLIIRTGGEKRLSNFLLYQGAYAELYFTDALWPDFDEAEFDKAMEEYGKRQRRFGKVL